MGIDDDPEGEEIILSKLFYGRAVADSSVGLWAV